MSIKKILLDFYLILYKKNISIAPAMLVSLLKLRKFIRSKSLKKTESKLLYDFFKQLNQADGIIFDVGASTGSFFETFLSTRNRNWKIFAFEPDPNRMKQEALKYFESRFNVTVVKKACSDKSGEQLQFFTSEVSTGISSLHSFDSSHTPTDIVETITLSDFIQNNKIDSMDILKIDTEGHDLFVLKGFPWNEIKPMSIMCEFENNKTEPLGYKYEDLGNYLVERGYNVFVSEWFPVKEYGPDHDWRSIKRYPAELEEEGAMGNFLCFDKNYNLEEYFKLLLKKKIH